MKPGYSKMETYPYRIPILRGYSRIRTHGVSELIILKFKYILSDTYKILDRYTQILVRYFTKIYPGKT